MRLLIVVCFLVAFSCSNGGAPKAPAGVKSIVSEKIVPLALELSVQGMTCTGCEQTIQSGLSALKGVKQVKANFKNGKAYVEYIPGVADTMRMRESITSSGYVLANIKSVPLDSLRLKK